MLVSISCDWAVVKATLPSMKESHSLNSEPVKSRPQRKLKNFTVRGAHWAPWRIIQVLVSHPPTVRVNNVIQNALLGRNCFARFEVWTQADVASQLQPAACCLDLVHCYCH